MKTLVVLSALAAVAIAAPTLYEEGSTDFKKTLTSLQDTIKREKKSTLEVNSVSNPAPGTLVHPPSTSLKTDVRVAGRSFGLKKPIIIKKTLSSHHVYRDSDEELVDSNETCGKQVKVKLCDVKSNDNMRHSAVEDANIHMSEEDMKHSIQLAKEAIENLQRDFEKIEHDPDFKASGWAHGHLKSDGDLHQDIEVAREALEHIHKNFGNLESMSLHATTETEQKNPFNVSATELMVTKTEEERLAQWKDAMATIHKNEEIVKNIEDSFKAADTGLSLDSLLDTTDQEEFISASQDMRTIESSKNKLEDKVNTEIPEKNCNTHLQQKSNGNMDLLENDMKTDASTISEKIVSIENTDKTKHAFEPSTQEKDIQPENLGQQQKNAVNEATKPNDLAQNDVEVTESINTDKKERVSESKPQNQKIEITVNADSVMSSSNKMRLSDMKEIPLDHPRNTDKTMSASTNEMKLSDVKEIASDHTRNTDNSMTASTNEMKLSDLKEIPLDHHRNADSSMFASTNEMKLSDVKEIPLDHARNTDSSMSASSNEMTMSEKKDMPLDHSRNAAMKIDKKQTQHPFKNDEHFVKTDVEVTAEKMKAAEHVETKPDALKIKETQLTTEENKESSMFVKSAEQATPKWNNEATTNMMSHDVHNIDISEQHFTEAKMAHTEQLKQQPTAIAEPWSMNHEALAPPEMRAVDTTANVHEFTDHQSRWTEDKKFDRPMQSMKSATGFHSQHMDHVKVKQMAHHQEESAMKGTHFDASVHNHHGHHHPRFPDTFMPQGKSADMDMPNYYMMRDGSDRFRWRPEAPRSAYGVPAAPAAPSSPGAIGVFPNANVGNCAIPLLLSCNPSVVSGNLAKAHPASYTSPAYRTEDDFSFHAKRDVTKAHRHLPTMKKSPTKDVGLKTKSV